MGILRITRIFYKIKGSPANGVSSCFARLGKPKMQKMKHSAFAWCKFHTADGQDGFVKIPRTSQFWRTDGIYYQITDKKKLRRILKKQPEAYMCFDIPFGSG